MGILDEYKCKKIVVTNASQDKLEKMVIDLSQLSYEVFSLESKPRKEDKAYFHELMKKYNLDCEELILIEHNIDAVEAAESVGIKSLLFHKEVRDYNLVERFLRENVF